MQMGRAQSFATVVVFFFYKAVSNVFGRVWRETCITNKHFPIIPQIMEQAADKMFSSTADFLRTELNSAVDDFQLLQEMNKAALQKYKDLTKTTQVQVLSQPVTVFMISLVCNFPVESIIRAHL